MNEGDKVQRRARFHHKIGLGKLNPMPGQITYDNPITDGVQRIYTVLWEDGSVTDEWERNLEVINV